VTAACTWAAGGRLAAACGKFLAWAIPAWTCAARGDAGGAPAGILG
jgi:hypothetical protein